MAHLVISTKELTLQIARFVCVIYGSYINIETSVQVYPPAITFIHLTFIGFLKNSRVLIKFLEKHLTARDQEPLILGKRAIFVREP